jgi:hypothetical protein
VLETTLEQAEFSTTLLSPAVPPAQAVETRVAEAMTDSAVTLDAFFNNANNEGQVKFIEQSVQFTRDRSTTPLPSTSADSNDEQQKQDVHSAGWRDSLTTAQRHGQAYITYVCASAHTIHL